MKLDEREAGWAERKATLTVERAWMTAAAVAGTRTMELDAALASWEAVERSLESIAGSSTERDAEYMVVYMTAEVLSVAFGNDYLAAARALGVLMEAATPPSVTMKQHVLGVETPVYGDESLESEVAHTGVVHG